MVYFFDKLAEEVSTYYQFKHYQQSTASSFARNFNITYMSAVDGELQLQSSYQYTAALQLVVNLNIHCIRQHVYRVQYLEQLYDTTATSPIVSSHSWFTTNTLFEILTVCERTYYQRLELLREDITQLPSLQTTYVCAYGSEQPN